MLNISREKYWFWNLVRKQQTRQGMFPHQDVKSNARKILEIIPKTENPRSVRSGIRQLQKYNKTLGGGYTMWLELYWGESDEQKTI